MSDETALECAICYDSIAANTVLPCSCKIDYCGHCWNKALASSFNNCGFARCPSCRSPVRVSFDADANRLVFSRETDPRTLDEVNGMDIVQLAQDTVERIAQEAMPAQIRILSEFGLEHSLLGDVMSNTKDAASKMSSSELKEYIAKAGGNFSDCLEKSDLVERLQQVVEKEAFVSMIAVAKLPSPKCVCGSPLEFVDGKSRLRRQYTKEQLPDDAFNDLYERVKSSYDSGMICDLCDGHLAVSASVWTCENGGGTILHASSYDICEACFSTHSCNNAQRFSERVVGEL